VDLVETVEHSPNAFEIPDPATPTVGSALAEGLRGLPHYLINIFAPFVAVAVHGFNLGPMSFAAAALPSKVVFIRAGVGVLR
jgi:hypothetical protein